MTGRLTAAICAFALGVPSFAAAGWVQNDLEKAFQRWGYADSLCYDAGYGAYPKVERRPLDRNVAAYADEKTCKVVMNSNYRFGAVRRCHVLVHEVGHLAGWTAAPGDEYLWRRPDGSYYADAGHSRRWRHIMWPATEGAYYYWRCRKAYPNDPVLRDWRSARRGGPQI